jgi:hypothetical protein
LKSGHTAKGQFLEQNDMKILLQSNLSANLLQKVSVLSASAKEGIKLSAQSAVC